MSDKLTSKEIAKINKLNEDWVKLDREFEEKRLLAEEKYNESVKIATREATNRAKSPSEFFQVEKGKLDVVRKSKLDDLEKWYQAEIIRLHEKKSGPLREAETELESRKKNLNDAFVSFVEALENERREKARKLAEQINALEKKAMEGV